MPSLPEQAAPGSNDASRRAGEARWTWLAGLLLAVGFVGWQSATRVSRPIENIDEGSWVFTTYWYDLAFRQRDLQSPDWKHEVCLDHPPLFKFLLGATLAAGGFHELTSTDSEWWMLHSDVGQRAEFLPELHRRVPADVLRRGRFLCLMCYALASLLVLGLALRLASLASALGAQALFLFAPLVCANAADIMADGLFLLLLLAATAGQVLWLERLRVGAGWRSWSAAVGTLIALATNTKILGWAMLPLAGFVLVVGVMAERLDAWRDDGRREARMPIGRAIAAAAILLVTFAIVLVATNPSLYTRPVEFVRVMFRHRWHTVYLQAKLFYADANPTPTIVAARFVEALWGEGDAVRRVLGVPLVLGLMVASLWSVRRVARRDRAAALISLVNAAAWVGMTAATYRMNWPRYVLVALPLTLVCAAAGADECVRSLRGARAAPLRLMALLVTLGVAVGGVAVLRERGSMERFLAENPEWLARSQQEAQRVLREEPTQPDFLGILQIYLRDPPLDR